MNKLDTFLFKETNSFDFSLSRFIFFCLIFYYYCYFNYPGVAGFFDGESSPFWSPISFFYVFDYSFLKSLSSDTTVTLFLVSVIFCALGLFYRFSVIVAFLTGLYLMGAPLNFGKIHHSNHLPVGVLLILSFSRHAGKYSLDRIIQKYVLKKKLDLPSPEFYWPIKVILIYMSLVYFASGFQKLRHSGLDWIFSDNMAAIILTRPTVTPFGIWVSQYSILCKLLAFATVFLELFAPLSLLGRRLMYFFMSGCFFMHIGAAEILGQHGEFYQYCICFVWFIPWQELINLPMKLLGNQPKE